MSRPLVSFAMWTSTLPRTPRACCLPLQATFLSPHLGLPRGTNRGKCRTHSMAVGSYPHALPMTSISEMYNGNDRLLDFTSHKVLTIWTTRTCISMVPLDRIPSRAQPRSTTGQLWGTYRLRGGTARYIIHSSAGAVRFRPWIRKGVEVDRGSRVTVSGVRRRHHETCTI